jgi:predicted transcriptional regulator
MLKVKAVAEKLGLEINVTGDLSKEVSGCYISDLLSDVMAHSSDRQLWVTLQTHPNIVAVAAIKGLSAIIITNGRKPEAETAKKAASENINILTTGESTFNIAGLIYNFLQDEH